MIDMEFCVYSSEFLSDKPENLYIIIEKKLRNYSNSAEKLLAMRNNI